MAVQVHRPRPHLRLIPRGRSGAKVTACAPGNPTQGTRSAVRHNAASDSLPSSCATMPKQTWSSRPEAVALDDQGRSGPPGPHRLLLPDARPSPTPRRTQGRRWRPPAPCHEEWCPRSLRRSRDRRLHRSRPGCGGHHRVPRRRFARARRCGLHARTCRSPRPPFECPTPRGHLDTSHPSSSGLPRSAAGGRPAVAADEMRRSAAFWPAHRPGLTHAILNPKSHRPRGRASTRLSSRPRNHSGSIQPLLASAAKDAELVTFRICQYNPRLITLANINTLCAMSHQTSHLGALVIRPEVEVLSALSLLALIKPDEVQPRQATRLRADLELLSRGVDHNPTKSLGPPLPQGHRIYRVNNHLLPFQGHPPNLDLPGLQEQAFGSEKTLVTDYVLSRRAPLVTVVESTDDGAGQLRSRP